jgi:hypothetical protein
MIIMSDALDGSAQHRRCVAATLGVGGSRARHYVWEAMIAEGVDPVCTLRCRKGGRDSFATYPARLTFRDPAPIRARTGDAVNCGLIRAHRRPLNPNPWNALRHSRTVGAIKYSPGSMARLKARDASSQRAFSASLFVGD